MFSAGRSADRRRVSAEGRQRRKGPGDRRRIAIETGSTRPPIKCTAAGNASGTRCLGVRTKERQNESYLEGAGRTERCNTVAWQRCVGERRGGLALPK